MALRRLNECLTFVFVLITITRLGQCEETCTDLMSFGAKKIIDHGVMKTAMGDLKTGLVVKEAIKDDNNVYFFHIRPICKVNNGYRYNCLALKTFSSYDELKTQNDKVCWEKQMLIHAQCRLGTIRIANGDIFCELQYDNKNKKPVLAKVSMKNGAIIKSVVLTKALDTTNCIKPRENYWGSTCKGEIYEFTVHTHIDQRRLWVLYQSQFKTIIEERSMSDLSSVSEKQIDKISSGSYSLLICGKLYELSTAGNSFSLVKAVEIANVKNTFARKVKFVENVPDASQSWVHYNERTNELFLGSPNKDSTILPALKCGYSYGDTRKIDFSQIKSTMMWSLVPTEFDHQNDMLTNLENYFKGEDAKTMQAISKVLLRCPPKICADINNPKKRYCQIKAVATELYSYADFRQTKPAARKQVQTHFDISTLLQQQMFKTMSTKMNALKSFFSKNFMELKQEVNDLGGDIGGYFRSLADFDRGKAGANIKRFKATLKTYRTQLNETGGKIEFRMTQLFKMSVAANVAKVAEATIHVCMAAHAFYGDIATLVSTSVALLNIKKSIDLLANALVEIVQTVKLKAYFDQLKVMTNELYKNAEQTKRKFATITTLFEKFEELTLNDLAKYGDDFLAEYSTYKPSFNPTKIAEYGTLVKNVIKGFCDIIRKSNFVSVGVIQAAEYTEGSCFEAKLNTEVMVDLLKRVSSNEAALMDSFVSAVRSVIAQRNADRVASVKLVIKADAVKNNHLDLKTNALELFVYSEVHRLMLVHEACALIEYRRGGTLSNDCIAVIANPQGQTFDKILANRFDQDLCSSDFSTKHVYIPAVEHTSNAAIPSGTIDLTALYSGKRVSFQVPNKQWLVDNLWINQHETNKMIVLKEFELFLPLIQNTTTPKPVTVRTSFRLEGMNMITPGGTQYDFSTSASYDYKFRYGQNRHLCSLSLTGQLPYNVPGCKKGADICLLSKGTIKNAIVYPSVYSQWSIKASFKGNLQKPVPKGNFYLVASAKLCFINRADVEKRQVDFENYMKRSADKRSATCCGDQKKYLDFKTNQCQPCPSGSEARLNGYYCEKIKS